MKNFIKEFKYLNSNAPTSTKVIYGILGGLLILTMVKKLIVQPFTGVMIGILIFSVMLHEIAHGLAAYINGDSTAKDEGRLTMNPVKHLDPLGTLLPIFLIATGATFVIGWAKPVPVNYRNLRDKKWGVFQVSVAGVLTNFILAFIGATMIKFMGLYLYQRGLMGAVSYLIRINLVLGIFNLIPIPPLDGSKVVSSLGSYKVKQIFYSMESYGFYIIIALAWFGLLGDIINPFYQLAVKILNAYIN
ncbi:site-2 protease family protein [uncultured Ilyobacter sp.]|uniref:site-2 protease family protein n=1 Tax=uncultured Ilyobacter sp. TaxID=544433 RepID=UPI0029C69C22|nr:site-2 protease family protein [uncultured Ilyobacter sp.]